MPTFAYTGRTRAGQTVSGERVADSMDAATAALRREQINVTRITPSKAKEEAAKKDAKGGKTGKKVAAKNLAVFTRQFSVMIDAGLPLVQCLDILGSQEEDKNFATVIGATRADVESGASLADAMRKHPKTFDPLFTNMIAAGEAGGILDTILKRLATYIEKAVKLAGQVKSAMIYPVAVIVIAGLVVGVILWIGRRPSAAHAHRDRAQRQPRPLFPVPAGRRRRRGVRLQDVLRHGERPARHRLHHAEDAGVRQHHEEDCRRPLLPDAVDPHQLGRADSGRSRDHGQDVGECHRRGRDHGDAEEHRARRDDLRAAEGHQGLSLDGDADDRRR
jgi:hypothetical protein